MDKIKNLGQIFTPIDIVKKMTGLIKNKGSVLEPSCGDGIFSNYIRDNITSNITSIEVDLDKLGDFITIMDFFDLGNVGYDTIVGNPPYVSFKNIIGSTIDKINNIEYFNGYDNRTNLYIFFIRKCVEHLNENGELIFITPREFIKSTSAIKLNNFLYKNGTITDWFEYGDNMVFKGYSPNVVIFRYEKNNFSRITNTNTGTKTFNINDGQISFTDNNYSVKFSDLFFVKVGAVSGLDRVFTSELGNIEFVCSYTKKTTELKRMFFNIKSDHLIPFKDELINRKMKKFNPDNWWKWGRGLYESDEQRIYVNCKTRDKNPFFTNDCKYYDGSVLAIFPKKQIDINKAIDLLNSVDWDELGFKVGNRFCFTQKSLENTYLPNSFI
jgi:adenine-specific DNA-methyltransferase